MDFLGSGIGRPGGPTKAPRRKMSTVKQRRLNRDSFVPGVASFKQSHGHIFASPTPQQQLLEQRQQQSGSSGSVGGVGVGVGGLFSEGAGLKVVVRKRPLFQKERDAGDWDAWSRGGRLDLAAGALPVPGGGGGGGEGGDLAASIWAHKASLRLDAKHMFLEHHGCKCV